MTEDQIVQIVIITCLTLPWVGMFLLTRWVIKSWVAS